MNNPNNNSSNIGWKKKERRMLPFVIEFIKFSTAFSVIIAAALVTLRFASASM